MLRLRNAVRPRFETDLTIDARNHDGSCPRTFAIFSKPRQLCRVNPGGQMAPGISRRELISTFGCAAVAWPLSARAQQTTRPPQIGVLYPGIAAALAGRLPSLRDGLRAVGYQDADTVEFVSRMSE